MKIPAKQQSDGASKHAILSRPSLIEKKEQDGSFHTRDARPLRYFLAPCWHAIFFFHSALLCFSPLTSLFIYLSFFWHRLSWDYCAANRTSCCVTAWFCFKAPHAAFSVSVSLQCQTGGEICNRTFIIMGRHIEGGCLVGFSASLQIKPNNFPKRYFCGYEYLPIFFFFKCVNIKTLRSTMSTNIIPPQFKKALSFKITVTQRPCIFH